MPIVRFPAQPPYNEVTVNTDNIYCALPDPTAVGAVLLQIDTSGGRSIQVLGTIDDVGLRLGHDFVHFIRVGVVPVSCFVNKRTWVSIVPHPQVAAVTQINYLHRYVPVKGTLQETERSLTA